MSLLHILERAVPSDEGSAQVVMSCEAGVSVKGENCGEENQAINRCTAFKLPIQTVSGEREAEKDVWVHGTPPLR